MDDTHRMLEIGQRLCRILFLNCLNTVGIAWIHCSLRLTHCLRYTRITWCRKILWMQFNVMTEHGISMSKRIHSIFIEIMAGYPATNKVNRISMDAWENDTMKIKQKSVYNSQSKRNLFVLPAHRGRWYAQLVMNCIVAAITPQPKCQPYFDDKLGGSTLLSDNNSSGVLPNFGAGISLGSYWNIPIVPCSNYPLSSRFLLLFCTKNIFPNAFLVQKEK